MKRRIIACFEFEDDEFENPLDMLEVEAARIKKMELTAARLLDEDDEEDHEALEAVNTVFKTEN